jgi:murein DD-endopeptidase MepM/ murein hydrolase activator NlpD
MSYRAAFRIAVLALVGGGAGWLYYSGLTATDLERFVGASPHARYTVGLKIRGLTRTAAGRAWLDSAEQSLADAEPVKLLSGNRLTLRAAARAAAYAVTLRRGQRYVVDVIPDAPATPAAIFVDVFRRTGAGLRPVGSAARGSAAAAIEIRSDGEYVVRVQPEVGHAPRLTLALDAEPTLRIPVEKSKPASIQSFFGDGRDGGRRRHHGVDIFARRGTPVLAAADGIVSRVGTNGLGGNVVWVARPGHRELHYYAHLDRQLVTPGTLVKAGDVLGTVGNTGNARRTPPHLHFGIYASGGPVDPLPYIAPERG